MSDLKKVSRALISVSDKTGIVEFAQALTAQGVEILSTGGTFRLLTENSIAATEVSDYTGFPEMMDGRVKTLHPKVHGGILGRRGTDDVRDAGARHQANRYGRGKSLPLRRDSCRSKLHTANRD